jgi:hypothetical protein
MQGFGSYLIQCCPSLQAMFPFFLSLVSVGSSNSIDSLATVESCSPVLDWDSFPSISWKHFAEAFTLRRFGLQSSGIGEFVRISNRWFKTDTADIAKEL